MKKLANHLQYSYWIYLLIALLAVVVWTTVFQSLAYPDDAERVSVLFFGSGLDGGGLEDTIWERIGELTGQEIRQIRVEAADIRNQEAVVLLLSTRVSDTDFIILSEEMLGNISCVTFFPAIPTEQMGGIHAGLQYYFEDGLPYGILIGGGEADNNFTSFYSGDETYYVLFSSQSVHFGSMFSEEEKGDNAAFAVLKYLLESDDHVETEDSTTGFYKRHVAPHKKRGFS